MDDFRIAQKTIEVDTRHVHTSKRACAHVYPSLQQQGFIWFWPNAEPEFKDIALRKKPPVFPELSDPSYQSMRSIRDLPYGCELLTENLMDPSHIPYAHHGISIEGDVASNKTGSSKSDRRAGRPMDFRVERIEESGFQGRGQTGPAKFIAPYIFILTLFLESKKEANWTSKTEAEQRSIKKVVMIFFCIPVSPGKSRLIWTSTWNYRLWLDFLVPRWLPHLQQMLILDSDLCILHIEAHQMSSPFEMLHYQSMAEMDAASCYQQNIVDIQLEMSSKVVILALKVLCLGMNPSLCVICPWQ
eukprot:Gb_35364 [translate_table: standard]